MRLLRNLLGFLLVSLPAAAQFTQVSGTVLDPNTVPYANGTIAPVLVITAGAGPVMLNGQIYAPPTQPAGLDKNGAFVMNLASNASLTGATTKWNFWVCSAVGTVNPAIGTGSQCFTLATPITIAGATQDISANLQAAALALTNPSGGGSTTFDKIKTGVNVQANMQVSSVNANGAAQLSPLNIGQVAGTQLWIPQAILAPSGTQLTNTGGSVLANHNYPTQITFNTVAGETTPSAVTTIPVPGGCGTGCSLQVNAPTLTAGETGYTVYSCDLTTGPCTSPQKVAACTNITTNCIMNAPQTANTSAPPTLNTAWIQPPNMQVTTTPELGSFFAASYPTTDGNYHGWLTLDTQSCNASSGPTCPAGTPVFFGRTWFSNLAANAVQYPSFPQAFKNSMVSINTDVSQSGLAFGTNQTRALGIMVQTPSGASGTYYGIEGIQAELDLNGHPTCCTNPDGEASVASFQFSDDSDQDSSLCCGGLGANVMRLQGFLGNGTTGRIHGLTGNRVLMTNTWAGGANYPGGSTLIGTYTKVYNGTGGNAGGLTGYAHYIASPTSAARLTSQNVGIYIEGWTNGSTNNLDRQFMFDAPGGSTYTKGAIQSSLWLGGAQVAGFPSLASNVFGSTAASPGLVVWGSYQGTGSLSTGQVPNTTTPACSVAGGTGTTYNYSVANMDGNGATSAPATCNPSANNPLNAGNTVTISVTGVTFSSYPGSTRIAVCRTGGPLATGLIGYLQGGQADIENQANTALSLVDNGLTVIGTCPIGTSNNTGGVNVAGDLGFTTGKGQHFNTQAANNDHAGTCTLSSGTPSTCTVTFTRAYTAAPVCVATNQTTQANPIKAAPTTANVVFTGPNTVTDVVAYICVGNPN